MGKIFRAGAAQQIITPSLGAIVNGDFYQRYAHTIHDDLFAKALVLDNGERKLILVIVDVCTMGQDLIDSIKKKINTEIGISTDQILIASNHTHGSGSAEELYLSGIDRDFRKVLAASIYQAVQIAFERRQPAKICFGSQNVPQYLLCRRYFMKKEYTPLNPISDRPEVVKTNPFDAGHLIAKPVSTPDPQLSFLAVKSLEDNWIGILANYSLHYAGDWEPGTITADYFGTFATYLGKYLGSEDLVTMMSNGTSGDINNWDFSSDMEAKEDFSQSERIGKDLAVTVSNSLREADWDEHPHLNHKFINLSFPRHKPSRETLEEAKIIVTQTRFAGGFYDHSALRHIYAREQILMSQMSEYQTCQLQAFQIGQLVIGALPGEFFAETGLWLKNKFPETPYFNICLANGNVGYVPPPDQFGLGGYETWRSRYSPLKMGAEPIFRTSMVKLIGALFDCRIDS